MVSSCEAAGRCSRIESSLLQKTGIWWLGSGIFKVDSFRFFIKRGVAVNVRMLCTETVFLNFKESIPPAYVA
jgi:hypothetical protein